MNVVEITLFVVSYAFALAAVSVFILLGLLILVAPKRAMKILATIDRAMRKLLMNDDWNAIERFFVRKRWLWPAIPSNVDITTPEDMRRYSVSDENIESGRFWIARAWAIGAILLGGIALVVLIGVLFEENTPI